MTIKHRYSSQQKQEKISRKQFEEQLELHEFVTEDISTDLGEDILVRIYDNGISTGLSFFVQLKSVVDKQKLLLKSNDIHFTFHVKDLEHWSVQAITVFLVVWDIKRKQGFWIWINDAVKYLDVNNPNWRQNKTANIHIPSKNQINKVGLLEIRQLLANLYYPVISKDKELIINAKFVFPKTPEGKVKLDEMQRHFASGDQVVLDGKYIELFDFPDWFKRLHGNIDISKMHLTIAPKRSSTSRPVQFEFISNMNRERIPYVELWTVKHGEEEITLTNDVQNIPIKFHIVLNKASGQNQININTNLSNVNSVDALQILGIQKILSDGGSIQLTLLDTSEVITMPIQPNSFPAPDPNLINFVENICHIQNTIGIKMNFPKEGSFTKKDILAVGELLSVIKTGRFQQHGVVFTANFLKSEISKLLEGYIEGSPFYFRLTTEESIVEILSYKIDLGPAIRKIRGYWRKPKNEVNDWLINASDEDSLVVQLDDVEVSEEYENWVKK